MAGVEAPIKRLPNELLVQISAHLDCASALVFNWIFFREHITPLSTEQLVGVCRHSLQFLGFFLKYRRESTLTVGQAAARAGNLEILAWYLTKYALAGHAIVDASLYVHAIYAGDDTVMKWLRDCVPRYDELVDLVVDAAFPVTGSLGNIEAYFFLTNHITHDHRHCHHTESAVNRAVATGHLAFLETLLNRGINVFYDRFAKHAVSNRQYSVIEWHLDIVREGNDWLLWQAYYYEEAAKHQLKDIMNWLDDHGCQPPVSWSEFARVVCANGWQDV